MNGVLPFLPKDNQEIPNNYGMVVTYLNSKVEGFELAQHSIDKENEMIICVDKEDIWHWILLKGVQSIQFDKRFSKIIALKEENDRKQKINSSAI